MKKYEITDIAHPDNPNLHRIRAVTDLTEDVLAGMLGGYVESCDNLDQEGRAWISADAIACENAVVCGDAVLTDHAVAKGCAYVGKNATVMGDATCLLYTSSQINNVNAVFYVFRKLVLYKMSKGLYGGKSLVSCCNRNMAGCF